MYVVSTKAEFRNHLEAARIAGAVVGLVPTMGALHAGHISLVEAATKDCDVIALTIFVNPLQFGEGEDLSAYPRPLERDLQLAEAAGVDVVFTPTIDEMYSEGVVTSVHVAGLTEQFEGASRAGHFDGVTTVVTKLFAIAGSCRAYFGQKDFQQLAVVRRMAHDLDLPIEVIGCPIKREANGLAMSSRNVYLSSAEREAATVLSRSLRAGIAMIDAGERDPVLIEAHIASIIEAEPLATLDYIAVVDPFTLERPVALISGTTVQLLLVAQVGTPRLLDNMSIDIR